jgi:hypothetical protein
MNSLSLNAGITEVSLEVFADVDVRASSIEISNIGSTRRGAVHGSLPPDIPDALVLTVGIAAGSDVGARDALAALAALGGVAAAGPPMPVAVANGLEGR